MSVAQDPVTSAAAVDAPRIQHAPARPARVALLTLLGIVLVCALAGRLAYLANPFDSDAAIFISMGRMTVEGGRLTHDLVDNKLPTVGLMLSVPWRAFGTTWPAYVLLGTTLSLATTLLLAKTAHTLFAAVPGAEPTDGNPELRAKQASLAAVFFSLTYLNFNTAVFGGFQLETPQVFFSTLAAFFFLTSLKHDCASATFTGALAAACAAYFKPSGLTIAGVFFVLVAVRHRQNPGGLARHVVALATGFLGGFIPVALYLTAADLWRDMPRLLSQIGTYARESAWGPTDLLKVPIVLLVLGFPFIIQGRVFRRWKPFEGAPIPGAAFPFVALWFALELAAIVLQRRMYAYHFLPLVPPAALLFAMVPRRVSARALFACLLPVSLASLLGASAVVQLTYTGQPVHPVSGYLRTHAARTDTVWSQDVSRILLETGLGSGSRFQQTFLFANYDAAPLDYGRVILADLQSRHTEWIVLRTDFDAWVAHQSHAIWELDQRPLRRANYIATWDRIRQYVSARYVPVARVDQQTIYRRRTGSTHEPAAPQF